MLLCKLALLGKPIFTSWACSFFVVYRRMLLFTDIPVSARSFRSARASLRDNTVRTRREIFYMRCFSIIGAFSNAGNTFLPIRLILQLQTTPTRTTTCFKKYLTVLTFNNS